MKPQVKSVITVSRKWNNPEIKTTVVTYSEDGGISLEMSLWDFKESLKKELGSMKFILSNKEFERRLDTAIDRVIYGIKEESLKVV